MKFRLARTRLLISAGAGAVAVILAMVVAPWQVAVLAGWNITAGIMVGWTLGEVLRLDARATRLMATQEDNSRVETDVVLMVASVVSLVGVGTALVKAAGQDGGARAVTTGVGILTVVLSWAVVHTTYMLRYARLYYAAGGGIDFKGEGQPDYRDFLYFASTIGMTYQVSDTDVTSRAMRRTVTPHALLSYLFGTVIVAVTINAVAGMV